MSDTDTSTDKPLENLAAAERAIDPPAPVAEKPASPNMWAEGYKKPDLADKTTATERLRAFEDENFGKDAVRINGMIERGSGSPYQMAKPAIRKQHIAFTNLIAAEQKRDAAKGTLAQAEADYAAAEKACDAAPE